LGLTGEVRRVKLEELREREAQKNGFKVLKDIKHLSQIPEKVLI
jgi:DNA repair protein RadA/Sms